jgi:hypothetical protein
MSRRLIVWNMMTLFSKSVTPGTPAPVAAMLPAPNLIGDKALPCIRTPSQASLSAGIRTQSPTPLVIVANASCVCQL